MKIKTNVLSLIVAITMLFSIFFGFNMNVNADTIVDEVIRLVNVERSKEGLLPLTENILVTEVAMTRAQELIIDFSHTPPTGKTIAEMLNDNDVDWYTWGENAAWGQTTPAQVVNSWMDSQGHRENILGSDYNQIGVGYTQDENGRYYWIQLFIGTYNPLYNSKYTVNFMNDSVLYASKTVTAPETTIDALPSNPTRANYTFGGWFTGENGTGSQFTASTPVTSNLTVYAKWTYIEPESEYIVNFMNDSVLYASKTVTAPETTIDALPSNPARANYTFGGWFTGENGTGSQFIISTPVTSNLTVYAKWTYIDPQNTPGQPQPIIPINTLTSVNTITDPYVRIENSTTSAPTVTAKPALKNAVIYAKNTTIKVGEKFEIMKGVTAKDDGGRGADITKKVTVSGSVNTAVPGKHTITYKVVGQNGVVINKKVTITVTDDAAKSCN